MLSTAAYLPQYNSGLQRVRGHAQWHEVGRGLQVAVLGDLVLVALSTPGLLLAWLAVHGGRALQLQFGVEDADGALWVGLLLTGAAAALGSGLNLLGRWMCLVNAPPQPGVKERLFLSILCSLGGLVLLFTAHFLGGARNYTVLQRGSDGLNVREFFQANGLLQLVGSLMLFFSCVLFSRFLRNVALHFQDLRRARNAERYFLLVCFMLGGTAGALSFPHQFGSRAGILLGVCAGWMVCFLWHLSLMADVRRLLEGGPDKPDPRESAAEERPRDSGLSRAFAPQPPPGW
jgi:hypothetical protein